MSVLGNDLDNVVGSEVLFNDIEKQFKWLNEMNKELLDHVLTGADMYDIMIEGMGNEISRQVDKRIIERMQEKGYVKSLFDISKCKNRF